MNIINNFFGQLRKGVGIDLGTANTLVWLEDKGIIINEPSIIAINSCTSEIIAIGNDAKKMLGKTPANINVVRPLVNGVISDFEAAESMIRYYVNKIFHNLHFFSRLQMMIAIPLGITEVEKKAVEDAAIQAGAREVYLIEEPVAAALGAKFPINESTGHLIVGIGGGTTEIAVLSLGGVVTFRSLKVAGDEFNRNIVQYGRENCGLLLGEKTAEYIKIYAGAVTSLEDKIEVKMRGRDLITGLPKEVLITSNEVRDALSKSINFIIDNIKGVLETTPPELVADIMQNGIFLTGGGSLLRGLADAIMRSTKVPVYVVDDPLTTVIRGIGVALSDLKNMKSVLIH